MSDSKLNKQVEPRTEEERRERMDRALALIDEARGRGEAPMLPEAGSGGQLPTAEEVCKEVGEVAVGRDAVIRRLAEFFLLFAYVRDLILKGVDRDLLPSIRSLFLVGPTASSKTFLIRLVCKALGWHCRFISMASLTGTGWRGTSVSDTLRDAADWQVANPGRIQVLFFDEADKHKVRERGEDTFNPAIDLLSVLNRDSADGIYRGSTSTGDCSRGFELNLDDVAFVFAGAFSGIEEKVLRPRTRREAGSGYGLLADVAAREAALLDEDSLRLALQPEDLVEWGILTELVGRASYVISMTALSEDDLRRIVNDSPRSLERRNALLMRDGVSFRIDDSAAIGMARRARESGLGARILDSMLQPVVAHAAVAVRQDADIESVLVTWDEEKKMPTCSFSRKSESREGVVA